MIVLMLSLHLLVIKLMYCCCTYAASRVNKLDMFKKHTSSYVYICHKLTLGSVGDNTQGMRLDLH